MAEQSWVDLRRVALAGLAGGIVWSGWSAFINLGVLQERYAAAKEGERLLLEPRYPFYVAGSYVILFILALVIAWLYAWIRPARGKGLLTAVPIGFLVGLVAGLPANYNVVCLVDIDKLFPLWWMLDFWVGSVLAALVAGFVYRD
jgi:hypothetical protein